MTTYSPSPRPTFDGPTAIPYSSVTRHVWGDAEAGEVADWIYASTDKLHCLVFGLPVNGAFRHSREFLTVFGADEWLCVLEGTLAISNPETGEVERIPTGGSVFFRKDTWHHAFACDGRAAEGGRVLLAAAVDRLVGRLRADAAVPRGVAVRRRRAARQPGSGHRATADAASRARGRPRVAARPRRAGRPGVLDRAPHRRPPRGAGRRDRRHRTRTAATRCCT